MSVWITVPQPIAADLHCTATVLAEAFPSGFIAGDPFILHWLDYFEISKGLACKVVFDLELGATARFGFAVAEAVRKHRYDIPALAFAKPLRFTRFCFWVFLYHCQFSERPTFQINEGR